MKRNSGKMIFVISHFTILILAVAILAGMSYKISGYVTDEMADKQAVVMKQAMSTADMQIEKAIKKAVDISQDEYVQWFYYIDEPLSNEERFFSVKLVERLGTFFDGDPFVADYYVYFGKSGRIANANSFYPMKQFYELVWSYNEMTETEWEERILNRTGGSGFLGGQIVKKDSAQRELLTYVHQIQKADTSEPSKVVLLLDAEQIRNHLRVGMQHGMVQITDAEGNHLLDCGIGDMSQKVPQENRLAHKQDGWEIVNLQGGKMLVNSVYSERTGWVYTSWLPMKYVTEDVKQINRMILLGVLALVVLGCPLCLYWGRRSYTPIRKLMGIFSEFGYRRDERNRSDLDYLEQSLCLVLEKHKDLEQVYQNALEQYQSLEENMQSQPVWEVYRQGTVCFSAAQKRKLVNYVMAGEQAKWNRMLEEICEQNKCDELSADKAHKVMLFVVDMVLIAIDDAGIDISRSFEGKEGLIENLLRSSERGGLVASTDDIFRHISGLINEHKLNTKEETADKAIEYMKQHYSDNDFGLGVMADMMHISPEHLSRVIKGVTGKNYTEILNRIRLEQAKIYLKTTDMKLDEIAQKVGCGNARNLIRIFKQYEGITPGKYR